MLQTLREVARAKVNLTLQILGRRPDGYHELASLVVFADVGDVVRMSPDQTPGVTVTGPFADGIVGDNIVSRCLQDLAEQAPGLRLGSVEIEKHLPVAAGLGGGSANAAAVLRVVRLLNPDREAEIDWYGFAARLGADVPVCLANCASWMTGIGEQLQKPDLGQALPLPALLVNPMAAVPADKTARVFRALSAPALSASAFERLAEPTGVASAGDLIAFSKRGGNDLQIPAVQVVPELDACLKALQGFGSCAFAAMSGAGPTCFGVFENEDDVDGVVRHIKKAHPDWWVYPTTLRSEPLELHTGTLA